MSCCESGMVRKQLLLTHQSVYSLPAHFVINDKMFLYSSEEASNVVDLSNPHHIPPRNYIYHSSALSIFSTSECLNIS